MTFEVQHQTGYALDIHFIWCTLLCTCFLFSIELIHWREKLLPIAKEYQGKLTVAMNNEEEYVHELKELSLADWGEEVAVAIWSGKDKDMP